jgi:hypothetical protein
MSRSQTTARNPEHAFRPALLQPSCGRCGRGYRGEPVGAALSSATIVTPGGGASAGRVLRAASSTWIRGGSGGNARSWCRRAVRQGRMVGAHKPGWGGVPLFVAPSWRTLCPGGRWVTARFGGHGDHHDPASCADVAMRAPLASWQRAPGQARAAAWHHCRPHIGAGHMGGGIWRAIGGQMTAI